MNGINLCAAPLDIDPRQRYFTTVQPFSYRDTLTVLGYVQEVAEHLDQLRERLNNLAKDVDAAIDANNQDTKNIADNLLKQMATLREELIRLVEQSQVTGVAWSPVYGKQDALQSVLDGMYDNVRNHGLFYEDYDDMQLEASIYDALGLSAREYDLRATAVDNCVPGDFPGRSQFPYGKSIPEGKPADVYLTTDSADAKYVQRNPTVANFETPGEQA